MANSKPFRKDFFETGQVGTKWVLFSFYEASSITKLENAIASASEVASQLSTDPTAVASKLTKIVKNNPFAKALAEKSKSVETSVSDRLAAVAEKAQTKTTINPTIYQGSIIMPMVNNAAESSTQSFSKETGPVESLLRGVAGSLVDGALLASRSFSQLTGTTGIVLNSDYNSVYNGGELRTFAASWEVIPKSEAEAKRFFELIQKFKEVSSPKKELGALFLSAPMSCKIEFSNKVLNDSMQFTDMVITNLTVNYSLSGFMETFRNGSPKAISLNIDFQDRRMKTREDWVLTDA